MSATGPPRQTHTASGPSRAVVHNGGQVSEITDALEREYGPREFVSRGRAVEVLVETVLSQNTSDVNSHRAYESLLKTFGSLETVATAPIEQIEAAIRFAGLSRIKSVRIRDMLQRLLWENGSLDLVFLSELELDAARRYLTALEGVGLKTASCVLLFSLGMPAMPVDTHVHRVARRLGLLGPRVSADAAHAELEAIVSPEDRYRFHLSLIEHGRRMCHSRNPRCTVCVLRMVCPSAQREDLKRGVGGVGS